MATEKQPAKKAAVKKTAAKKTTAKQAQPRKKAAPKAEAPAVTQAEENIVVRVNDVKSGKLRSRMLSWFKK